MHDLGRALGDSGISEIGPLRLRLRCSDTSAVGAQADIKRGHRECAAATSSRLACRRRPAQQVRQLGYVRHDVPGRHRSHGALTCAKLGALCAWKG